MKHIKPFEDTPRHTQLKQQLGEAQKKLADAEQRRRQLLHEIAASDVEISQAVQDVCSSIV